MKTTLFILLSACLSAALPGQTDPNHSKEGGYGYRIASGQPAAIWWAEGCYKVMRDAPVPKTGSAEVVLASARNEFESFILVVRPERRMERFRVTLEGLSDGKGHFIDKQDIAIRKVEYVNITKPTDEYGFPGWWPDPLPPYDQLQTLTPGENQPFWITVKTAAGTPAGHYAGELLLSSGDWRLTVPVKLEVWDFCLPQTPSIRSGFGAEMSTVNKYENLKSPEEQRKVFDYYMESFRDYRISPYDPFLYAPIREEISGVAWQGGFFDSREKLAGNYAYRIVDNSPTGNMEASTRELIPVTGRESYRLCWMAKAAADTKTLTVGVECYDAGRQLIVFGNRFDVFTAGKDWKADTLNLGRLDPETRYLKIRLFPSNRTVSGEDRGTVWFDNLTLLNAATGRNDFPAGDFEADPDRIDIRLDFTDFNQAGKKYFDEYGFTGYRLPLRGLGGGTYYSRENGVFEGFEQGTVEYNKLMQRYLAQMQDNLEKNGWLGKEYIYWFDEPGEADYPFVRETNALIKRYAPKISTFLTEHLAGQDISDVTDISCTIWHKLNHDKIRKINERGRQAWSYLCCWPKSPWISEFIDHDAVNLRMWLWASWQYRLKGILVWSTTYWNSDAASPEGYLQNPWEEPMSYVTGYGWPLGKQTFWGNGDGRFFYPVNRDPNGDRSTHTGRPVPSVRLEILRDGIEDYEYFTLLDQAAKRPGVPAKDAREASQLLEIPSSIYSDEKTYSKNPQDLLNYRKKVAEQIMRLKSASK